LAGSSNDVVTCVDFRDVTNAVFDFICDAQLQATGKAATAFRGGGYRFNRNVLDAMMERGVRIVSSVNISRKTQPAKLPPTRQFCWSNGGYEIPVSVMPSPRTPGRGVDYNFNARTLSSVDRMMDFARSFFAHHGDDAIAVMVLHSWSLL